MRIKGLSLIKKTSIRENRGCCIELFGGEPSILSNLHLAREVFAFSRNNKYSVGIATNGVGILDYKKELVIYRWDT